MSDLQFSQNFHGLALHLDNNTEQIKCGNNTVFTLFIGFKSQLDAKRAALCGRQLEHSALNVAGTGES